MSPEPRRPNKRPEKRREKDSVPDMSRRSFLTGLTGVTAGATLPFDALAGNRHPGTRPERTVDNLSEQELSERFTELLNDFPVYTETGSDGYLLRVDQVTLSARDEFRDRLLNEYGAHKINELIKIADKIGELDQIYFMLYEYQCQGFADKYLADAGRHNESLEDRRTLKMYFQGRAADYLPTPEQIALEEIDPRMVTFYHGDEEASTLASETLLEDKGWTSRLRQKRFKEVLGNPEVRQWLQNSNMTLAEAYSIIKATVIEGIYVLNGRPLYAEKVKQLMVERENFMVRDILGPFTETFISMTYNETSQAQFDQGLMDDLATAAGISLRHNKIDTAPGSNTENIMLDAIARSTGVTAVFFNTHGFERGLSISEHSDEVIDFTEIALALVDRIVKTGDAKTLADVDLVFLSCHSNELARLIAHYIINLFEFTKFTKADGSTASYQEMTGFTSNDIAMPHIISAAQEGSLAYTTSTWLNTLPDIEKSHALTGEHVMRKIQPIDYHLADYTIFKGGKAWLEEIAALDSESDSDSLPA